MDLLKAALSNSQLRNIGYNNFNTMSNEEKLREQLYHCTYNDDVKFIIEKSVRQVLHVYPSFQTEILTFSQNGQQKRFLEIKGILQIQIRGKICKVDYNMMVPNSFPRKPPYVRIINRNDYLVDPLYKSLQSPTDPKSYILNGLLQQVKRWSQSSSIVSIVIESNKIMRQNFPFFKPSKNPMESSGTHVTQGWASINQKNSNDPSWGMSQGNFNYNSNFNNQGFNNQGFNNQGFNNQGFNNQGFNPNQNFNYNQGGFNNGGFNNVGNQGFGNNYGGNPVPPIPFQSNVNIGQAIANSQKFVGQSKKIMEKMKAQHIKTIQKIQHLQTIKSSLDSEQEYLRNQNMKMSEFLRKNQKSDMKSLSEMIRSKDERSQQILNLVSSIKAKQDCITLLEDRFSANQLSFEQFVKYVKKLQEQKFEEKVLISKCIEM